MNKQSNKPESKIKREPLSPIKFIAVPITLVALLGLVMVGVTKSRIYPPSPVTTNQSVAQASGVEPDFDARTNYDNRPGADQRGAGSAENTPANIATRDRAIVKRIRLAIADDPQFTINTEALRIVSKKGFVTLAGTVSSLIEKEVIFDHARSVTGVQGVVDKTTVQLSE